MVDFSFLLKTNLSVKIRLGKYYNLVLPFALSTRSKNGNIVSVFQEYCEIFCVYIQLDVKKVEHVLNCNM